MSNSFMPGGCTTPTAPDLPGAGGGGSSLGEIIGDGCFGAGGPDIGQVLSGLGQEALTGLASQALGELLAVKDSDSAALAIGKHLASQFQSDIQDALSDPAAFLERLDKLFNGVKSNASVPVGLDEPGAGTVLVNNVPGTKQFDIAKITDRGLIDFGPVVECNPTILFNGQGAAGRGHHAVGLIYGLVGPIVHCSPNVLMGSTTVSALPAPLPPSDAGAAGAGSSAPAAGPGSNGQGAPGSNGKAGGGADGETSPDGPGQRTNGRGGAGQGGGTGPHAPESAPHGQGGAGQGDGAGRAGPGHGANAEVGTGEGGAGPGSDAGPSGGEISDSPYEGPGEEGGISADGGLDAGDAANAGANAIDHKAQREVEEANRLREETGRAHDNVAASQARTREKLDNLRRQLDQMPPGPERDDIQRAYDNLSSQSKKIDETLEALKGDRTSLRELEAQHHAIGDLAKLAGRTLDAATLADGLAKAINDPANAGKHLGEALGDIAGGALGAAVASWLLKRALAAGLIAAIPGAGQVLAVFALAYMGAELGALILGNLGSFIDEVLLGQSPSGAGGTGSSGEGSGSTSAGQPIKLPDQCFTGSTLIATPDGPREIQSLRAGDLVLCAGGAAETLARPILRLFDGSVKNVIEIALDEETIQTTAGHPFYVVGRGWVRADELAPGLLLRCNRDGRKRIRAMRALPLRVDVFNLCVEEHHNYFVSNTQVLVHNMSLRGRKM